MLKCCTITIEYVDQIILDDVALRTVQLILLFFQYIKFCTYTAIASTTHTHGQRQWRRMQHCCLE